jgi:NADPH-dependent 2,4-dienoyl-CoA reductase/sulfur reductase-like enzyme
MALVIIGGVAAGMSAATRARRFDPQLEIVVLEKGPSVSYGACGLPYLVEGRVARQQDLVVYTPEYFRKQRKIDVRTGARVVSIAHSRREVTLETGERVRYDKLVIAAGARCDSNGIEGAELPHVFTLHTLEDGERMRRFLQDKKPHKAVVVGSGYSGLEVADALRRNGLAVTVMERSQHVLLRDDPPFTAAVRKQLEQHGVELRCEVNVRSIADLDADMVVLSAGFKPNVEIARDSGIEIGRTGAIRVDDAQETNLRGVYAAGDCAEVTHLVTGRPVYIPLGTTANKSGRVAGANAAGGRERFPGVVGTLIVGVFGVGFGVTGLSAAQARAEGFSPVSTRIEAAARPRYFNGKKTAIELVADRSTRRLIGGSVIGEQDAAGRLNVIAAALQAHMRVDEFQQLDLAYSPPFAPTWDPLLIAAQQLMREL